MARGPLAWTTWSRPTNGFGSFGIPDPIGGFDAPGKPFQVAHWATHTIASARVGMPSGNAGLGEPDGTSGQQSRNRIQSSVEPPLSSSLARASNSSIMVLIAPHSAGSLTVFRVDRKRAAWARNSAAVAMPPSSPKSRDIAGVIRCVTGGELDQRLLGTLAHISRRTGASGELWRWTRGRLVAHSHRHDPDTHVVTSRPLPQPSISHEREHESVSQPSAPKVRCRRCPVVMRDNNASPVLFP